jgi:hypothetical protein
MAVEVVARRDQEIDPDPICALGDGLDLEGFAGRQELRVDDLR